MGGCVIMVVGEGIGGEDDDLRAVATMAIGRATACAYALVEGAQNTWGVDGGSRCLGNHASRVGRPVVGHRSTRSGLPSRLTDPGIETGIADQLGG